MASFRGSAMTAAPDRNPFVFGEITRFPVGSRWKGRRELCNDGVHAYLVKGIHGRSDEGAYSVVISGGYEDDLDLGYTIIYTGEGGTTRDSDGKWSNKQIKDQEWVRGNKALKRSLTTGNPVRIIRGSGLDSPYAPAEGYRYDGLYTVEEVKGSAAQAATNADHHHAVTRKGASGFLVCKFRFERCPEQPPIPGADESSSSSRSPTKKMAKIDPIVSRSQDPQASRTTATDLELAKPSSPFSNASSSSERTLQGDQEGIIGMVKVEP